MKVRYTPEAFADRERILEYLKERSESGSRNVAASIHRAVAQLGDQPHSGYQTDNPAVRVSFVVRYPYKDLLSSARRCCRDFTHPAYVTAGLGGREIRLTKHFDGAHPFEMYAIGFRVYGYALPGQALNYLQRRPLATFRRIVGKAAYLSPSIPRKVFPSQDDGAETRNGLRADPGAVPGASTLAA
jgi:plasmid stabilization system protein ParE